MGTCARACGPAFLTRMTPTTAVPDTASASLARRRHRAAESWALNGELVLVGAGEPLGIPGGGDQKRLHVT